MATRFGAALKEAAQPLTSSRLLVFLTSTGKEKGRKKGPFLCVCVFVCCFRMSVCVGAFFLSLPLSNRQQ